MFSLNVDPALKYGAIFIIFHFLLLSLLLSSCAYKPITNKSYTKSPIFIEMPQNKLVFDNISPLVYQALRNHYARVGYNLISSPTDAYILKTTIKDLKTSSKFLSPDVLTYAVTINLVLFCELFDTEGKSVARRTFPFATLISNPKDFVENSEFSDFEYRRLLERSVFKIDQYFRRFL